MDKERVDLALVSLERLGIAAKLSKADVEKLAPVFEDQAIEREAFASIASELGASDASTWEDLAVAIKALRAQVEDRGEPLPAVLESFDALQNAGTLLNMATQIAAGYAFRGNGNHEFVATQSLELALKIREKVRKVLADELAAGGSKA